MIDRRSLLRTATLGGIAATALRPIVSFAAAPTDKRFVFIIQRGAADGLHTLAPLGDPGYAALRGPLLGSLEGAQKLDAMFALHPALARTAGFYQAGEAIALHAVATVYRDRSHFDGQNVLESGGRSPYSEPSGWLNRLIGALPAGSGKAMAYAPDIPMALRGPAPVTSYAPSHLQAAKSDLLARIGQLYAPDPQLSRLWQSAIATHALAEESGALAGQGGAEIGRAAAALLRPADGARLMMIETLGWDTHSGQAGRLAGQLRALDSLLGALADGLGPLWHDTLVLVATEFGRTAALNGTEGTDHGTASAALLLGGGLKASGLPGGRVQADWPGLAAAQLYENRDLRPTTALESVVSGALARHYTLDPVWLARRLYPEQGGIAPLFA